MRVRPKGSVVAGMPADEKAPVIISFNAWWRAVLLGAN